MSNVSLKEQLQAVASQLSDKLEKAPQPTHKPVTQASSKPYKPSHPKPHRERETIQKPKPKWLDYVQYGVELLKVHFPACFKPMNQVAPLKKGIKQDLVQRLSSIETIVTDDKACMVKSLAYYVNTAVYHKSVINGATRIDLDGQPAGTVTLEEATYSIERQQAKHHTKLAVKEKVPTE